MWRRAVFEDNVLGFWVTVYSVIIIMIIVGVNVLGGL
jgi:hypothetical protein